MDITETAAQREVRERYRAWLDDFLPADYHGRYAHYREDWDLRRAHQREAFAAGWLMPGWEPGLGGQGLGSLETLSIRLEAARQAAPKLPNIQGPNVVAPGLRKYGTAAQQERHLVPLLRGDEWWALGMSEPDAGSDFGSLRTRAVRERDVYVVNGQKIWTTQAHESRFATLYCRTDPDAPKHKGISCLICDLDSPGITIRPIRMASDGSDVFCEVFLDDVEVPVENLLGAENDGWAVAMASLNHERDMIWVMNWVDVERGLDRAASALAAVDGGPPDDLLADLGRRAADAAAIRLTGYRSLTNEIRGERSREFLVLKLLGSEALQHTWELAIEAAGPAALVDAELLFEDFEGLGATIYGGTSEVQRNIIGERALGLPKG
jgi:alkylation response protein AidB-like acyl-CoA dehydrogenase